MRVHTHLALGYLLKLLSCDHEGDDDADDDESSDGSHLDGGTLLDAAALDATVVDASAVKIARGKYLTSVIYPCGGCHTPRNTTDKVFSGIDCWSDSLPNDTDAGCLSSKNLTDDSTGLKGLSNAEVKGMFLHGRLPDGAALFPQMPYALLGNINEADADAIVAYLRSLPPVDHQVRANQPPYDVRPAMPAETWPEHLIPTPRADYPEREAALRGRYLAGNFGGCMDCHTPRTTAGAQIRDRAFSGGRKFGIDAYAPNLTPDSTGIAGYTVDDIVGAIKRGEDPDQNDSKLCAPMPSGPMGAYGNMTDADARDIAHYLLSIPPIENAIPGDCQPDAGVP